MIRSPIQFLLYFTAVALMPCLLSAGTLDAAPFRVVVRSSEWRVDDSTAQPMGKEVLLVATVSHTNGLPKSVVIKAALEESGASALDQLCSGMRDALSNPIVSYYHKRFPFQGRDALPLGRTRSASLPYRLGKPS